MLLETFFRPLGLPFYHRFRLFIICDSIIGLFRRSACWTCGRITADVGKNIVIRGCLNGLAESTVSSEKTAAVVVFPRGWLCAVAPSFFFFFHHGCHLTEQGRRCHVDTQPSWSQFPGGCNSQCTGSLKLTTKGRSHAPFYPQPGKTWKLWLLLVV